MKTYLLIGAGPGIGLATAERFAVEGYRVVLAARNTKRLEDFAQRLRLNGHQIETARVDAIDSAAVAALVREVGSQLTVLHYNAGVLHYDESGQLQTRRIEDESIDSLGSDITVNLTSALAAIKTAAQVMGRQGTILVTGGGFGIEPTADFLNISVAKAGLRAATKALFPVMQKQGIHIATVTVATLVSPGSLHCPAIAEAFWKLHAQEKTDWSWEILYS